MPEKKQATIIPNIRIYPILRRTALRVFAMIIRIFHFFAGVISYPGKRFSRVCLCIGTVMWNLST